MPAVNLRHLDQLRHLPLRLYVGLNVALGRAQSRMAGRRLHVSEVIIARCRLSFRLIGKR